MGAEGDGNVGEEAGFGGGWGGEGLMERRIEGVGVGVEIGDDEGEVVEEAE